MTEKRKLETSEQFARAVFYGIEEAIRSLGPVTDENMSALCILKNIPRYALMAAIENKRPRDLLFSALEAGVDHIDVSGWCLDWWPEYPDWVFDGWEKEDNKDV